MLSVAGWGEKCVCVFVCVCLCVSRRISKRLVYANVATDIPQCAGAAVRERLAVRKE